MTSMQGISLDPYSDSFRIEYFVRALPDGLLELRIRNSFPRALSSVLEGTVEIITLGRVSKM